MSEENIKNVIIPKTAAYVIVPKPKIYAENITA